MKFNPDCMRDILLYLEENLTLSPDLEIQFISVQDLSKNLPYPIQEIANMVLVLDDAEFIDASRFDAGNQICELLVLRITYSGYQLIESIRPQPVWEKNQVNRSKHRVFFHKRHFANCIRRINSDG